MNREAMKQQILEALSKKLGDGFHLSIQKVLKTNVKLDGLTIIEKETNISPVIYLEPFYEYLEKGTPIGKVADMILHNHQLSRYLSDQFALPQLLDFEQVKNRLYVELINRHLNKELLKDIPHALFLDDFAVTIRCMIDSAGNGIAGFLVHNGHLSLWNIDRESLISHALHNTRSMMGISLRTMKNVLMDMKYDFTETDIPDCPFWVLTNKKGITGAATVLFDDFLKDFAMEHGSFYVIFSSVHEALLIPESDKFDIGFLTRTNQVINATEVQADEILGNRAYYYSRDKGFIY